MGIANVMVVSVLERRREIGVRRALGAPRSSIGGQFLIESVLLSLLGGVAGVVLGVAVTWVFATGQGWAVTVPWLPVLAGLALLARRRLGRRPLPGAAGGAGAADRGAAVGLRDATTGGTPGGVPPVVVRQPSSLVPEYRCSTGTWSSSRAREAQSRWNVSSTACG